MSASAHASSVAEVGSRLFADPALSADGTVACASCHRPDHAFSDPRPVSIGVRGLKGSRNAPSLLDVAQRPALTWDGRTNALGDQVLVAFTHPREHALPDAAELRARVSENPSYRGRLGSTEDVRAALVAYLTTLTSGESAFDRWRAGDTAALSDSAKRGFEIFTGRGGCAQCHQVEGSRPSFTDNDFHRVGVGLAAVAPQLAQLTARVSVTSSEQLEMLIAAEPAVAALGRFLVTRKPADIGKYRTPSLRNAAVTAPYFHDGSVVTLEAAVAQELYYRSQERRNPPSLNREDEADLVAFLRALTDDRYARREAKGE